MYAAKLAVISYLIMCFILSLPQSPSTPTCHPSFHPHPENPRGQWPPTPTGKGHPSLPTDGVVSPCSSLGSDRGRLVPVRPAGLCMGPPAKEERKMTSCIDGCIYISMQLVHNMPLNAEINGAGWGLVWWLNTTHMIFFLLKANLRGDRQRSCFPESKYLCFGVLVLVW